MEKIKFVDLVGITKVIDWVKTIRSDIQSSFVSVNQIGQPLGVAELNGEGVLKADNCPAIKSINGKSLYGEGNITIDLSLFTVVTALPTTNINKDKIYLVKTGTESQNSYTEYVYTGDTTAAYDASKWEKLGEYRSEIDLSGYAKSIYTDHGNSAVTIELMNNGQSISTDSIEQAVAASSIVATDGRAGVMTAVDKKKLDHIFDNGMTGINIIQCPTSVEIACLTHTSDDQATFPLADTTNAGAMSPVDKTNLNSVVTKCSKGVVYNIDIIQDSSDQVNVEYSMYDNENSTQSILESIPSATEEFAGVMSATDKEIVNYFNNNRSSYLHSNVHQDSTSVQIGTTYNGPFGDLEVRPIEIQAATADTETESGVAGVMSAEDKTKLDSIEVLSVAELESLLV